MTASTDRADAVDRSVPEGTPSGHRFEVVAAVVAVCAAVLPMVVVVVTRWASDYLPVQDLAVIDLRTRDVFGPDMPLVGVYSQFGWNHPGPVFYWLVAPFVLLARGPWGLIIASATVQAAAVLLTGVVAWRGAGPRWALFWTLVVALTYNATGAWILLEAWNPHLAVPLFVLFLALAWRAAATPASLAASITVVGSMLVQIHIGYVPLVGAVGLWLAVVAVLADRRGELDGGLRRPLVRVVAAGVVMWAVPLLETVLRPPGNFRALFSYFVAGEGSGERAGLSRALGLVATEFSVWPAWLGGPGDGDGLTGLATGSSLWWLLGLAACVGVGIAVYRRCGTEARALLGLSWVVLAAGVVALTLLRGKVAPYLFYWRTPVAVLVVLASAVALWSVLASRRPALRGPVVVAVAVGLASAVVVASGVRLTVLVLDAPREVMAFEEPARELLAQVGAEDLPDGPVIVRFAGSPLGGLQAGLIDELDRRGAAVGVDEGADFQWGAQRALALDDADEVWFVVEQGFVMSRLRALDGARVVAEISPLRGAEELELRRLQTAAEAELSDMGRSDVIDKLDSPLVTFDLEELGVLDAVQRTRLAELNETVAASGSCRCGVVAFPAGAVPPSLRNQGALGLGPG